ncbi:MAG: hypothetical protein KDB03_20205 [Planctomycetales bacterium]|nr:hypothetical protein [Planctomycetales bacterium]
MDESKRLERQLDQYLLRMIAPQPPQSVLDDQPPQQHANQQRLFEDQTYYD